MREKKGRVLMKIFLVGGAVRDRLLNLPLKDKDWIIIGSTPEELIKQGFKPVGKDFPVFLHPISGEEYALARTEKNLEGDIEDLPVIHRQILH